MNLITLSWVFKAPHSLLQLKLISSITFI